MWSNRWSTMPIHAFPELRLPRPDRRASLDLMPGSDVPVIRQPFDAGDPLPFWGTGRRTDEHLLYDLDGDPRPRTSRARGSKPSWRTCCAYVLAEIEAPADQHERLAL